MSTHHKPNHSYKKHPLIPEYHHQIQPKMNELTRTFPLAIPIDGYGKIALATALLSLYAVVVRYFRYQRCTAIQSRFQPTRRPLSSMTVKEAHQIIRELRELEFPYSLHNAMKISLLKVPILHPHHRLANASLIQKIDRLNPNNDKTIPSNRPTQRTQRAQTRRRHRSPPQ